MSNGERRADALGAQGEHDLRTAVSLMRMALALLDRGGAGLAAAHLQHAIDTLAEYDGSPHARSS